MRFRGTLLLAGVAVVGLLAVASLAGVVRGGALDPIGPPASTMKTLDDIPGSWHRLLDADGRCIDGRFICVMDDEAVLDLETGLVWQRNVSVDQLDWGTARRACELAEDGGRMGWRLPTVPEFASLIDPSESGSALPASNPFTGLPDALGFDVYYWTQERELAQPASARAVNLADQQDFDPILSAMNVTLRHWCVRGADAE